MASTLEETQKELSSIDTNDIETNHDKQKILSHLDEIEHDLREIIENCNVEIAKYHADQKQIEKERREKRFSKKESNEPEEVSTEVLPPVDEHHQKLERQLEKPNEFIFKSPNNPLIENKQERGQAAAATKETEKERKEKETPIAKVAAKENNITKSLPTEHKPLLALPHYKENYVPVSVYAECISLIDLMSKEIKIIQGSMTLRSDQRVAELIEKLYYGEKSDSQRIFLELFEYLKEKLSTEINAIQLFNETAERLDSFLKRTSNINNNKIVMQKKYFDRIINTYRKIQQNLSVLFLEQFKHKLNEHYAEYLSKEKGISDKSQTYKRDLQRLRASYVGKSQTLIWASLQSSQKDLIDKTKKTLSILSRFKTIDALELQKGEKTN